MSPSGTTGMYLYENVDRIGRTEPGAVAVVDGLQGEGQLTYGELARLSDRLRSHLVSLGAGRGDRVGMYLRKSADGVATILGILKSGAAYVPVDPSAPVSRNAYIHGDCDVKAVVIERRFLAGYQQELEALGKPLPPVLVLEDVGAGRFLQQSLEAKGIGDHMPDVQSCVTGPDDLAYILYTSGSTGKPKGVMLSHGNAQSFLEWCAAEFHPEASDVFSSHAPFHFDLSVLDLFLPLRHGARLALVGEAISKEPAGLAGFIEKARITVWYSAPSILSLIAQFGKIDQHDHSALRTVLFAGEVFPVAHLRSLQQQWPGRRYFNLYGPTETNVCTSYEVREIVPADRTDPYPIGRVCSNLRGRVVNPSDTEVQKGAEGELCIAGPNVMQGYWELPEQTTGAFLVDEHGTRWYRTGDIVSEDPAGDLRYLGRRDRMVKKRGYRVELGEIEACLYRHPGIREAAVVALPDEAAGMKIKAHVAVNGGGRLSLIALKSFCSRYIPVYMVPDAFGFHDTLPRTSTDKIDYQSLKALG